MGTRGVRPHNTLFCPSLASGECWRECEIVGEGRGERKRRELEVSLDVSKCWFWFCRAHYIQPYEWPSGFPMGLKPVLFRLPKITLLTRMRCLGRTHRDGVWMPEEIISVKSDHSAQ